MTPVKCLHASAQLPRQLERRELLHAITCSEYKGDWPCVRLWEVLDWAFKVVGVALGGEKRTYVCIVGEHEWEIPIGVVTFRGSRS